MKVRWILLLISLSVLMGWGCSGEDLSAAPPSPNVIASFNGGLITKEQLKARFDDLMPCCKGRYKGEEGTRTLLKEMVLPSAIAQSIKQKKIDLRENIREELGNLTNELNMSFLHMKFHEQILNSDEKYMDIREGYEYQKRVLKGYPLSERFARLVQLHRKIHKKIEKEVESVSEDYIQRLRREAAITKNSQVLRVKVTAEELKDFYRRHKEGLHGEEYRVPERIRVQEIVVQVNREQEDCPKCAAENERKAKEEAESALTELRSGAVFRTTAEKYGSDLSKPMKSRWISRGSNGKGFEEAVFSLEIGEITPVLKQGDSFHIVKALEKQPGRFKPFEEIKDQIEREYRWQKGEDYLKENKDRILFTIDARPYTIEDFIKEYKRDTPPHQCHHMEKADMDVQKGNAPQLCDLAHNDFEEQKKLVDRMIDRELITEDTYNQMIHVEHQKEIEFLTMASLYPVFHKEEMNHLIHITDDMVQDYYESHKEDYRYPAKAKISLIVIRGGEKEEKRKKAFEKARRAHEELKPSFFSFKEGRDFAEVAKKYSDDEQTAGRGGRLDVDIYECRNAVEYMLMHGFHKTIFDLKPGDISEVFEFGEDFYIIQIREMEGRKQLTFDEVREAVKKDLMDKKHGKVMVDWEDDLLRSAGFLIYDKVLKEALAESVTKEKQKVKES
jgi:parvulin-like peptidyl-prolyl isomerase